jgi:Gas vesicle synthesis protein GvpO
MSQDQGGQDKGGARTAGRKRRPARTDEGGAEGDGAGEHTESPTSASGALGTRGILDAARELADVLDWRWEALTGLRRTGDGWTVSVDVVETRRVPSTTDLIAVYEMEIDREGELLGYERKRHYVRGRGDNDHSQRS